MVAAGSAVLTVVGSGTLVPDGARGSAAHHVAAGDVSVLLDCGSGTLHGLDRYGVPWPGLTHVAISHFHGDHVGDLGALLVAFRYGTSPPRRDPITLLGPPGLSRVLTALGEAHGQDLFDLGFPLAIEELSPGRVVELGGGVDLRCHPTPHTAGSLALRLDGPWGSLAYTGDTGPSAEVAAFLAGSAVVIAECSHADPPPTDRHLTPDTLAHMAVEARPELLVVTHVYPPMSPEQAVARVASAYDGAVQPGLDGLRVTITGGSATVDLPPRPR